MHNVRLSPAGLQALGQLRQLRHLRLFTDGSALSYRDLVASVSQLECLQEFRFLGAFVDSSLVATLCHLRQLSALELQSFEGPLPDLSPLTALAGTLTELGAVERQGGDSRHKIPPVQLEPFFRFHMLDHLLVGGHTVKLPGGREVTVHDREQDDHQLPPAAALQMQRTGSGVKLVVSNARLHESGLVAALLGTVAPNGTPMLGLVDCSLSAAAFVNCAASLATTTRLVVHGCLGNEPGNPLGPALDFMLRQAPQLRSLEVDSSQSAGSSLGLGPPPEIATLRHLTCLELVGTQLPHLEGVLEGLPDLAHLDVRSNRLRRLPASLSQCIKLTALLLGHNDDLDPLGLIDASVLTLASLPALQRVQLPYTPAAFGFRLKLKAAAPHIKDITIPS